MDNLATVGLLVAVLVLGSIGIAILWAMLYAMTRRPGEGREACDPDKETPPAGSLALMWVVCTHCDRGWWKDPRDDSACPYCNGSARPARTGGKP